MRHRLRSSNVMVSLSSIAAATLVLGNIIPATLAMMLT